MIKRRTFTYYSFDKVLSYNAVLNFIVGGRGIGKSWGAKVRVVKRALRSEEQFIYLRRYQDELKEGQSKFFADIVDEFPEWDFKVEGRAAMASKVSRRGDKKRKWKTIGFFVALSVSAQVKSTAFPNVTEIIFDEFIIEKGMVHYLPKEYWAFLQFFETVDRKQDKTRAVFLANSVSISNPYFNALDIRPDKIDVLQVSHGGYVAVEFPDSKEFRQQAYETRFGRFIAGTEYGDYSIESEFADGGDELLAFKPSEARYAYTIQTKSGFFSVWVHAGGPVYYIQEKRPASERKYALSRSMLDGSNQFLERNARLLQILRNAMNSGFMRFDTPKSRNAFIEVFERV